MNYWWVNHKQTFRQEFDGKYVWCPKLKSNGHTNHFYETLRGVQPGDLVYSYANAALQGFGFVLRHCYSCPRPDEFGKVGMAWNERGWRVDVDFQRFPSPLRAIDHSAVIAPLLPKQYSPIQANGHGNQGAYFSEIPKNLAYKLAELADYNLWNMLHSVNEPAISDFDVPPIQEWEDLQQRYIESETNLIETTRKALVLSRIGQGLFKKRVSDYEKSCRITQVSNPIHLIASHIKPWRESDNEERLSPGNGLLLTPSIDHLFDRGFISFTDDGELIRSPVSDLDSLQRMGIHPDKTIYVGQFNSDQKHFLDYHRKEILLQPAS